MRWDNLTIEAEQQDTARLPGYAEQAVVRRFDAPEALDTRFYEVRAKSALNKVPEQSKVPFRWTVNPYRGCSHACAYCQGGETPILMGDGRLKQIRDLRVGDAIYGTVFDGKYRRYTTTTVLAHWRTLKRAYRVTLADGTELVASGDHRFLSGRGWKHVTGAMGGVGQRPYLTTNDSLLGFGSLPETPHESLEYQRGYLAGMIRGDGTIGHYRYAAPERQTWSKHSFRLALADDEALMRTRRYLTDEGILLRQRVFSEATERRRAISAIATSVRDHVARIERLIELPRIGDDEWCRGFLAGIFDAEGGYSGSLRISNSDDEILGRTIAALDRFGFASVLEPPHPNGVRTVRVTGGLREHLRFFAFTDPAITRKRRIAENYAIKSDADLRVVSIEDLGMEIPMYDITTGTGDFIANGVVSHNCFARPTHTYLDLDAGRDFEKEIVVKVNVGEVLARQLRRPSWTREHVALGTNTDPYQWVESKYRLMRDVWAAMRDARNPCSILTKSPLVLRDLDLLQEIAAVAPVSANLSVPTIDREAWRASEPHTPSPRARLEAVGELNRAGIPCGVLVAPLMPGINDDPRQVEEILALAAENGATRVGGITLHLRGETRGVFMDWLRSYRPDLVPRYEALYAHGAYAPKAERDRLAALLRGAGPLWPGQGTDDFQLPPDPRGLRRAVAEAEEAVERPAPRYDRRPHQEALF